MWLNFAVSFFCGVQVHGRLDWTALTWSTKRIPAQGKPSCMESALTATSPTALNRFSQRITLSASFFKVTFRPAYVNGHLFSIQYRCFFSIAAKACRSAESRSLEAGTTYSRGVARSLSQRTLRALSNCWGRDEELRAAMIRRQRWRLVC
jgi:hypothetical protein